jgi:hypothetical protein
MPDSPAQLKLIAPSASPEEAAAIVAALERFIRATSRPVEPGVQRQDPWQRAAILEGVARESGNELPDPWINT